MSEHVWLCVIQASLQIVRSSQSYVWVMLNRCVWHEDPDLISSRWKCNPSLSHPLSQLVPWLRDSPGGGVSAAVLQRGQLPGQEQRVGQQQVLHRPQVSAAWKCMGGAWRAEVVHIDHILCSMKGFRGIWSSCKLTTGKLLMS